MLQMTPTHFRILHNAAFISVSYLRFGPQLLCEAGGRLAHVLPEALTRPPLDVSSKARGSLSALCLAQRHLIFSFRLAHHAACPDVAERRQRRQLRSGRDGALSNAGVGELAACEHDCIITGCYIIQLYKFGSKRCAAFCTL